ncbi:uncharacterized protein [Diadema antillarum]|uniref:uncharacterized protein n=1 Tax=Diadema antillarum TaxID=105358 RepID=UPI003A8682AB
MSYSAAYTPAYTPVVPRRKRRSKSVPPTARTPLPSSSSSVSSSYTGAGKSYQQRAYESVKSRYMVPQTIPPRKSLTNANNLIPPPSYRNSLMRIGETTGLREADPYYYASRDYLSRTGSYYGTYSTPRKQRKPASTRYSQFYPNSYTDIYSPGYGHGYLYGSFPTRRQRVTVGYRPVIVESHDDLVEAKPLTKVHQAKVQPTIPPPVRAVTLGKADVATDHGPQVHDLEQRADDLKTVVSPPVRAVQLGKADITSDGCKDVIDLGQRAETTDAVVPPVRAVQMGQAQVAGEHVADDLDFDQVAEVAADLDVGVPVRAIQLAQAEVASDYANDVVDLDNPGDGHVQKAEVLDSGE